jgi:hypothetical protein
MREFNDQPPNAKTALYYASHGWAVLPVQQDFRSAARDPILIKEWDWAEGIGMACGEPSSTDVFDIDDAQCLSLCGLDLTVLAASTLAATTPTGGVQLYFNSAGVPSRCNSFVLYSSTGLVVPLPPAPGRLWLNDLTPQPAPPVLIHFLLTLAVG